MGEALAMLTSSKMVSGSMVEEEFIWRNQRLTSELIPICTGKQTWPTRSGPMTSMLATLVASVMLPCTGSTCLDMRMELLTLQNGEFITAMQTLSMAIGVQSMIHLRAMIKQ